VIGRDAGELAGLGANGSKVVSDAAPLLKSADKLIEFTIPAATLVLAELSAATGIVHVIGMTGHSTEEEAVIAKAASRVLERLSAPRRSSRANSLLACLRSIGSMPTRRWSKKKDLAA
jgi:4-hydroxy-tetrahydrodipicolinate reductase